MNLPKFFASIGSRIKAFSVDVEETSLTELARSFEVRGVVQYACVDRLRRVLYVGSSDGSPRTPGSNHFLRAISLAPEGNAPHQVIGEFRLPFRPIHVALDRKSEHLLVAYTEPSGLSVLRLANDGSLESEVVQSPELYFGSFPHQVLVMPSNRTVIVVSRGYDAGAERPEVPGALRVFRFSNGVLEYAYTVAPNNGYGFGPRNVALDPAAEWLYASLERQNKIQSFQLQEEKVVGDPVCELDSLLHPEDRKPLQLAGAVKVHPNGMFVYQANRAFGTEQSGDLAVHAGGENTIAVYRVDRTTGRMEKIQTALTHGIYPRTFSIDRTGRMLIVANARTQYVRRVRGVLRQAGNLAVFAIGSDGTIAFKRAYEASPDGADIFWSGMVEGA